MQVESRLRTYRELVDRRLAELIPSDRCKPNDLHAAMRYSCLAPGKRLRPALCLASAEAVGCADLSHVLDAACAVEMVHCFSLIHDDLPAIDDDELRRGIPTCHVKFGEALALLAGDALFALSFELLASVEAEPSKVVRAVRILSSSSGSDGLVGGEVEDVLTEGKAYDANGLEFIHSRKTGALIAASCEIGGLLGGASSEQVHALRLFGAEVGLSFQIIDDILNETSTPEKLGKSTGSDREKLKATYPGLYGLEGAREAAQRHFASAVGCLSSAVSDPSVLTSLAEYCIERGH